MDEDVRASEPHHESRPWTIAAAMEPIPPLAPPPARPGAGMAFGMSGAGRRGPGPLVAAASVGLILVAAAVILVLILTAGH